MFFSSPVFHYCSSLMEKSPKTKHSMRFSTEMQRLILNIRLTAAVGSLCVQATGRRNFQSVSPSSWSVRTKQEPGKERTSAATKETQTPLDGNKSSASHKRQARNLNAKLCGWWAVLKPLMAARLSESITLQMIIILKQKSWTMLHSWNIIFIIDLMASTWRKANQALF